MKKFDVWRSDWFLGVVIALVLLAFSGGEVIQSLERTAHDLGSRTAAHIPGSAIWGPGSVAPRRWRKP